MLDRIKRILGLPTTADENTDFLLDYFLEMYKNAILIEIDELEIPLSLEFILIEVVCARWNKRGQEGLKQESIDVVSQTFHDELLDPYRVYFRKYKENKTESNRVRFYD